MKHFFQGCLITAFAFSLAVNYLYFAGVFANAPMSDEQRLAAVLEP